MFEFEIDSAEKLRQNLSMDPLLLLQYLTGLSFLLLLPGQFDPCPPPLPTPVQRGLVLPTHTISLTQRHFQEYFNTSTSCFRDA
jgi:hypothetical protein